MRGDTVRVESDTSVCNDTNESITHMVTPVPRMCDNIVCVLSDTSVRNDTSESVTNMVIHVA